MSACTSASQGTTSSCVVDLDPLGVGSHRHVRLHFVGNSRRWRGHLQMTDCFLLPNVTHLRCGYKNQMHLCPKISSSLWVSFLLDLLGPWNSWNSGSRKKFPSDSPGHWEGMIASPFVNWPWAQQPPQWWPHSTCVFAKLSRRDKLWSQNKVYA